MKTCEINKEIKIFLFADLIGEDISISDIEKTIKNAPYHQWEIDMYNTFYVKGKLVDAFVFETYKSLCFNINEVF